MQTLIKSNEVTDCHGRLLQVGDLVVFSPGAYNKRATIEKLTLEGVPGSTDAVWFVHFPGHHVLATNCQKVSR